MDEDQSDSLDFEEFVRALAVFESGVQEEKLNCEWCPRA